MQCQRPHRIWERFHPFRVGWMNSRSWRDALKWGASSWLGILAKSSLVRVWRLYVVIIKYWLLLPLLTLLDSPVMEWEITWLIVCIWRENESSCQGLWSCVVYVCLCYVLVLVVNGGWYSSCSDTRLLFIRHTIFLEFIWVWGMKW